MARAQDSTLPEVQEVTDAAPEEIFYLFQTLEPFDPDFESEVISGVTSGGSNFDVGVFLGAGRYYSNGITGQGTKTANVEAGTIWNGHETLSHVTNFIASSSTWSNGATSALYDRHATWVGMVIGGRGTTNTVKQQGIAYGTDLISAALATSWSGTAYATTFSVSDTTYRTAMTNSFALADVLNSSFAYVDPNGSNTLTRFTDALLVSNRTKVYVTAAGNSGPSTNSVSAPGSGYNTITVAALGSANSFNSVASFSSRSPQDFLSYTTGGVATNIAGVRAAVDISAPGSSITTAYFGGQSGGNNPSLSGSATWTTNTNSYSTVDGTSFASPLVAGGVSLMVSAAKTLARLSNNTEARQNVVLKSILLTGADKTSGWTNGQTSSNGVITTTQSLDWAVGAGRMNLDNAFDIQVNGQLGVAETNRGAQGRVSASGWDFGASVLGTNNDYTLAGRLLGGSTFTTTLSWLREAYYTIGGPPSRTLNAGDVAQADLNLSLWQLGVDSSFTALVAQSVSLYNTVEHLAFALPSTGYYGLRVSYGSNTFDLTSGTSWGTSTNLQTYGLAWDGTSVAGDQVPFVMQTNRFNAVLTTRNNNPPYAGVYNNNASEVGLYANGGSLNDTPGAAAFQTITTTGSGTNGTARPLQVGDTFTVTAYAATNPSAGGRVGIAFRDSTNYTDFFSSTDSATEARLQLDSSGNWKIYEGATERMASGSGPGADRTLVIKITSSTTFDASIGGAWYYNFTMGAEGGSVDSFALYSYGDTNPDTYWKNGLLEDTGTVELGSALGSANSRSYSGNVFTPGVINDGLAATNTTSVGTNAVLIGGDAGSQVNLANSNGYTGATTVNANATAELQHAQALGSTVSGTTVSAGATLKLYSAAGISFAAEPLTLHGSGVSGTNGSLRNVGGTNTWNGAITLGSDARINADTAGGPGSLTIAANIAAGTNVLFVGAAGGTNGGHVTITGVLGGGGGTNAGVVTSLYKDGAGTVTLTGLNTFTGSTKVAGGTLTAAGVGANQSLGSTASILVSSGATLLVGSSNQINNSATVTLSGGTITRGSGVAEVFGNLNLTQASFLDFGTGAAGNLSFGTYTPSSLLTINNFGLGSTLVFGSDLRSTINTSSFFTFTNGGIASTSWNGSTFTITAIPEPSTYAAGLGLLALVLWPLRHRQALARVAPRSEV